jgi:F-box/leucine-rich repeat protein 2/20
MLEILELANIGPNLRDLGLVKLLESCPHIRKIDLEDASSLTDRTIAALTPAKRNRYHTPATPLEHAIFSNIPELSEAALVRLVRACPNLQTLECANSSNVSDALVKAFLRHVKRNKVQGAEVGLIDCRSVNRQAFRGRYTCVNELSASDVFVSESSNGFRPRRGLATYDNRHFEYLDAANRNLAECDATRM